MKSLIYTIALILIVSCTPSGKNVPENFDYGTTKDGLYENLFFNMKIPLDTSWVVQSQDERNQMMETSSNLIVENNPDLEYRVKASTINTAYLLSAFKYEVGTPVPFNPSFAIIAENTSKLPGIKNGSDYLFHLKATLEQLKLGYVFREVNEKRIGSSPFHVLEAQRGLLEQEYYSTISNGFSLTFILSYTSQEDKETLHNIINNIEM